MDTFITVLVVSDIGIETFKIKHRMNSAVRGDINHLAPALFDLVLK